MSKQKQTDKDLQEQADYEDDLGDFDLFPDDSGDDLGGIDLDFLSEEVDKEAEKKGQSTRMRQISNYPQGYFVVHCDFEGSFEVTRLAPEEGSKRMHEPNVFNNWSKLRSTYLNTCRRKRKQLMESIKKIENYHETFKEEN